jgi:hypothetical protein
MVVGFFEEPEGKVGFFGDPWAEEGGGEEALGASAGEEVEGPGGVGVRTVAEVVLEELFFGPGSRRAFEGEEELGEVPHGEGDG